MKQEDAFEEVSVEVLLVFHQSEDGDKGDIVVLVGNADVATKQQQRRMPSCWCESESSIYISKF